ncbi:DUF2306 domain-containing protein [Phenylobacterium sp. VNQ135]|uniref:DUF2306 domain-containing protein n=1 Tax=Phenylobacterium sp. VNQ135 TaxID=3400922 RepID=UPI003C0DDCDA
MSQPSQTGDAPQARFDRRFALRFGLGIGAVVAILAVALGGGGDELAANVRNARLHGPDVAIWGRLSLPIKIHLLAAVAALALGAALMAVRKGRRFHRIGGWGWVALVSVTAGSTLFITSLKPGSWSILHLFTAWTLIALPLAVVFARRHNVARHRGTMMGLFYGGFAVNVFIAFLPGRSLWQMFFG